MPDHRPPAGPGSLTVGPGDAPVAFAGDLFMTLAIDGRLVVDPVRADALMLDLERTLDRIASRLRLLRTWQHLGQPAVDQLPEDISQTFIDAVFADQLAPGQLERAVDELPKYIKALRLARRAPTPE
jgi:hypothetical protein